MEADWDEVAAVAVPAPNPHAMPTIATTVAFDTFQELLWVGNEYGRIISFYSSELQRYTSTKAHPVSEGPVRQFLFHAKGVISISAKSIHLISRRGLTLWHITHPEMTELRCMSYTSHPAQILVAGLQKTMFVVDVEKGTIWKTVPTDYHYTIMRKSRYICAATDTGSVSILDLTDFKVHKVFKAHGTIVNDMDARNDFLVTCGFSARHLGAPIVDPLANVYDLKSLMPLPPIPFHAGAAYVRMHPKLHTTAFIASQTGQIQVVDIMNPHDVNLKQANVAFMTGLELASSGEALAFNDGDCCVHLWGSPHKIHFTIMSKETEFADVPPARSTYVDWIGDTPLSSIGMPYYHDKLLSAWPSHLVFDTGYAPPLLDPAVIPYLRDAEMGHYAPNPRKTRRYQIDNNRLPQPAETSLLAPRFLSEKARERPKSSSGRRMSDAAEALAEATLGTDAGEDPLIKYNNVEIKYSKFGVDDFDFRYYNKTKFSGLETHISNSFTNALLQLLKFIPLIRNVALRHAASSCIAEHCLLCEMGFLFDMLDKANGQNCQATNLLKTFSSFREAATLGLLEDNLPLKAALSTHIQNVNRFFLNQILSDYRSLNNDSSELINMLSISAAETIRCIYCRNEIVRPGDTLVSELQYPAINRDPKYMQNNPAFRFSSILKASIEREGQNRGWCNKCRRYQQLAIRRTVHQMPLVLMINALLNNPVNRQLWAIPGWLPEEIGILVEGGQVYIFEGEDLAIRLKNKQQGIVVYELVGFVAEIDIVEQQKPHLVSFINVDISSRQDSGNQKQWHLFNDFLVTKVQREEALMFGQPWKLPCVLSYQVKSARHAVDDSWKDQIDTTLLFYEWSINERRPVDSCRVLSPDERPPAGIPVALDTEFVDLEKAEIEVKADGSQEMIRPSRSGLARVSVLRGSGTDEGLPFIDDYITIKEPIVDYVTQYSGIKPGDLDVRTSTHNLVPLKVAYKKLWLLLNLGCVFIGHGLASDFRKINIQVPKSQTVDTQYLFFHPSKNRRLSLRYLAWAVFKEFIQEEPVGIGSEATAATAVDGHDSIEDARMALRLWRKYQEFVDAGIINQMLEEIFREGFKLGFKPPQRNGAGSAAVVVPKTPGGGTLAAASSGRNTPDVGGSTFGSAPSTPTPGFRRAGLGSGNGGGGGGGGMLGGNSPLR